MPQTSLQKLTRISLGAAMFISLGATTCSNSPEVACGNQVIEASEACDDGAQNANTPDACRLDCSLPTCGDLIVDTGEQCDDGNQSDTDICKNDCTENVCGDGLLNTNIEGCDDGNTQSNDGCSSACQVEFPACGNGLLEAGEQCDDGNSSNADACTNLCINNVCGDSFLNPSAEECDDGNTQSGDGCDSLCQNELVPSCGDGIVQVGEQCDDANQIPGDGCEADCTLSLSNPSLAAINPNNSLSGFDTADVEIDGAGFAVNAAVTVAGVAVPTSSCDYTGVPTQIICTIPASNNVIRGDVSVTNPDNQSTTLSNAWTFTGVVTDADFCNVQFPKDLINAPGTTPVAVNTQVLIFGQLFEGGLRRQ